MSAHIAPATVAALYVQKGGCYFGLDGVDPWDEARDARLYMGPYSVVAHPPCERWGRYATGGPSHHGRFVLGDDAGCFAAALASVRAFGGVLEHPADSQAWRAHDLMPPPRHGGWVPAGDWRGWTRYVEQGHYGHVARKATWLYAVGTALPELTRGPSTEGVPLEGFTTTADRRKVVRRGVIERLSKRARAASPAEFRDLLIAIARTARRPEP